MRLAWTRSDPLRLAAVTLAFAIAAACNLNPQPEVPGNTAGGAAGAGGIKAGGAGGVAASGGATSGGSGGGSGGGGLEGGLGACSAGCAAGELCNGDDCVTDICASPANNCSADEACKPNADFTAVSCFDSCANVTCAAGQSCVDGTCKASGCADECASGELCLPAGDGGYACTPDPCTSPNQAPCGSNKACDPVSGGCVPDPCNGVKCPASQVCRDAECYWVGDAESDAQTD